MIVVKVMKEKKEYLDNVSKNRPFSYWQQITEEGDYSRTI